VKRWKHQNQVRSQRNLEFAETAAYRVVDRGHISSCLPSNDGVSDSTRRRICKKWVRVASRTRSIDYFSCIYTHTLYTLLRFDRSVVASHKLSWVPSSSVVTCYSDPSRLPLTLYTASVMAWVSEQRLISHSMRNRSFRWRVFPRYRLRKYHIRQLTSYINQKIIIIVVVIIMSFWGLFIGDDM